MKERRQLASELMARGSSERTACRAMGLSRSTYRYKGSGDEHSLELKTKIVELSRKHKRYGYRRITAILNREEKINHKRVWRVWKAKGLSLPRRRPKKRRVGHKQLPTVAEYRGHVWTYDFVYDRTESNRVLKMLVVLDEYTRECHQIRVEYSLDSQVVRDAGRLVREVRRAQAPKER